MRLIGAFIKTTRPINLFFIALTQFLFHSFIIHVVLKKSGESLVIDGLDYYLLTAASICIAAAGYIINDYFDINIDQINKPSGNAVDSIISRRWAILWHFIFSTTGVLLSGYIWWRTGLWFIPIANTLCVMLLFGYSVSFKRKLLSGNILISLLTAWVILILMLAEVWPGSGHSQEVKVRIIRLGFLYAGFAFIISLVREAVKDMEDMAGDARYGCRTMPIVWGLNVSKVFTATWLIVLITAVIIMLAYILPFKWWWAALYCALLIVIPLLYLLRKLVKALTPADFHKLSNWLKLIMLTGILSMLFFKLYS